jgi:dethiobiotin synthetase
MGVPEHAAAVVVVHVQPGCVTHVLELREVQAEGVPVHEGSVVVHVQPSMAAQVEEDRFELQVITGVPVHPAGLVSAYL